MKKQQQSLSIKVSVLIIAIASLTMAAHAQTVSAAPEHHLWNTLLQRHVDASGQVSYTGFKRDSLALAAYLDLLSTNAPTKKWTRDEQLAYWINAYNAYTVKLVTDHWPVKGIREIGPELGVPIGSGVWDVRFFSIGGEKLSLNDIEHNVLRAKFEEPRIHFAIVCASVSCPKLLNEAYTALRVQEQLQEQTSAFVNDPVRNHIAADRLELSSIFKWFKSDFTSKGTLIQFVQQFTKTPIAEKAKVSYLDYDWGLNGK